MTDKVDAETIKRAIEELKSRIPADKTRKGAKPRNVLEVAREVLLKGKHNTILATREAMKLSGKGWQSMSLYRGTELLPSGMTLTEIRVREKKQTGAHASATGARRYFVFHFGLDTEEIFEKLRDNAHFQRNVASKMGRKIFRVELIHGAKAGEKRPKIENFEVGEEIMRRRGRLR
jgi:hypothetical protein